MTLPEPSDVAAYVKLHLGGNNWDVLTTESNYGISYVTLMIEAVKRRIMKTPVSQAAETSLDPRLLNYLGICSALDLLSAVRAAWASRSISRTIGNDPVEITRFTDRSKAVDDLRDDLMLKLPAIQAAALPILDQPVPGVGSRPAIDECDDLKVTADPRCFPPDFSFPYDRDSIYARGRSWR